MEPKQSEGEEGGSVEFSEKGEENSNMSSSESGSRHSMESGKMKVVVALDQSEGSFDALKWALRYLFSGPSGKSVAGSILLVHVQEPFHTYVYPVGPAAYVTSPVMQSVKKAQQMNAELLFAKARHLCNHKQVEVDTVVLEGDPKEMICQAAEEHRAGLLVVGSRGLSNIKRVFLGSVSDYCAHHARCPVVIVKPHTL